MMDFVPPASLIGWIILILEIGLRIVALGIIPGNRRPAVGTAWLLLILIEPILGFTAFLFLGRTKLGAKREARQVLAIETTQRQADLFPAFDVTKLDAHVRKIVDLNVNLGACR